MSGLERDAAIRNHYQKDDGTMARVRKALEEAGIVFGQASVADLAPVDQFHTRGLSATRELAKLAAIPAGCEVLDVGSGIGGPARFLAETHGCQVTGIDLSPEFCALAELLSAWSGLSGRTTFRQGNALDLPYPDESFDLAWTFQAQMNIEDKDRFYGEIFRVLRPGAPLAFQDIFQGNGQPLDFPVPWASDASINYLAPPAEVRKLLLQFGFQEVAWNNVREIFEQDPPNSIPPEKPGLHTVLGEEYITIRRPNSGRAFKDGRIEFYQGVFEKPA